jgi:hypothetical protein
MFIIRRGIRCEHSESKSISMTFKNNFLPAPLLASRILICRFCKSSIKNNLQASIGLFIGLLKNEFAAKYPALIVLVSNFSYLTMEDRYVLLHKRECVKTIFKTR